MSTLSYIVIFCSDVEASRQFYAAHGLDMRREQHDGGPVHYSCALDGVVLELYPAGDRPPTRTRLGLRVPGAEMTTDVDPDGNILDIEPAPETAPAVDPGHGDGMSEPETPVEHLTLRGMAALCEFWPQDRPVAILHRDGSATLVSYACHEYAIIDGERVRVLALADHLPFGDDEPDA